MLLIRTCLELGPRLRTPTSPRKGCADRQKERGGNKDGREGARGRKEMRGRGRDGRVEEGPPAQKAGGTRGLCSAA
jgi:hypothetical protein